MQVGDPTVDQVSKEGDLFQRVIWNEVLCLLWVIVSIKF